MSRMSSSFGRLYNQLYSRIKSVGVVPVVATASVGTGIGFAAKAGMQLAKYLPTEAATSFSHEIAYAISAPLAVMGISDGISAIYAIRSRKNSNRFDYLAVPFRMFPALAPALAYFTHGDILTTVGASLAAASIGQILKDRGNKQRNGGLNDTIYSARTKIGRIAGSISLAAAGGILATGMYYGWKGWHTIVQKYVEKDAYTHINREISWGVGVPLFLLGALDGRAALREIKTKGKDAKVLDYAGAGFRALPAIWVPISAAVTGDMFYTIGGSLASLLIGHTLTHISNLRRNKTIEQSQEELI